MPPQIFEYLKTQRVGVLAVEMPDGSPHGATVHFAHTEDPFLFYFETSNTYKKAEAILGKEKTRATYVVGSDESNPKTFQVDGIIEVIKPEEMENFQKVYLGKFPEKVEKSKAPDLIFFKLTPVWWRFTDFRTPEGKKIWASE